MREVDGTALGRLLALLPDGLGDSLSASRFPLLQRWLLRDWSHSGEDGWTGASPLAFYERYLDLNVLVLLHDYENVSVLRRAISIA